MGNALIYPKPDQFSAQQVMDDPILRYFHFAHLPTALREISEPFCDLAEFVVDHLPRNAERSVALRKLLEAKDAAVRANVEVARKETFYDRLLAESKTLETQRERLSNFFGTDRFDALDENQKELLRRQDRAMADYAAVLGQRIASNMPMGAKDPMEDSRPASDFWGGAEVKIVGGDQSEKPIPFD